MRTLTDSKREAVQCDELARAMGYEVVNLEQQRAPRTHVGLSDRIYLGKHAFFFERKTTRKTADGGADKLSVEQHKFLRMVLDAGALASCGGYNELEALLRALQRPSLVHARNLCADQIDQWVKRGFRGQRSKVAA